jgi:GDP-L-fucose synthase
MSRSSKTIFVTGASGFIGKNAVEYFSSRYQVLAPLHGELDLLSQSDVRRIFRENEIDYVIHCANVGGNRKDRNVDDILKKNLTMFFNLAENEKYFEKMIHMGSGAEYNKETMRPKENEIYFGKYLPFDDYGLSKYIISKYIEKSDNIYCLRLFGVFGKYEDYEYKFISNAILKNILHLPITIMQNVFFDWLYVDDLIYIIDLFIKCSAANKAYNITSGVPTDLFTIAETINKISDFKSEILVKNPGLNLEYSGDNKRLLNEIGNFKFHQISNAIAILFNYYKSIIHKIDYDAIQKDEYAAYCKIISH